MLLVHGVGRTDNVEQIAEHRRRRRGRRADPRRATWPRSPIGHEIRRGAVTANGQGEVVLGLGFMLMGENSYAVTQRLADKLDEVKQTLPAGRRGRRRLRPHRAGRPGHRHGAQQPVRGRRCWSSPSCSSSWATCGPG